MVCLFLLGGRVPAAWTIQRPRAIFLAAGEKAQLGLNFCLSMPQTNI